MRLVKLDTKHTKETWVNPEMVISVEAREVRRATGKRDECGEMILETVLVESIIRFAGVDGSDGVIETLSARDARPPAEVVAALMGKPCTCAACSAAKGRIPTMEELEAEAREEEGRASE